MKRVLITGANSYIGQSFESWVTQKYSEQFQIETLDMIDGSWRKKSFVGYDVVFHVAGLAHADVGKVSEERKKFYYKINRDLAVETAQKAKKDGVKQFVFMSSMIIYGESAGLGKKKIITGETLPCPANFYGDSKWQADQGVRALDEADFHVAVLRPPMIYGNGSKGNYPLLAKMAKKLPVFPDIQNERSMLHVDNLCEFLCLLMLDGRSGIFFPQNEEYVKTSEMVRQIAAASGHGIWITKLFNPLVWCASMIPGKISGLVNKAFGSICYAQEISKYSGIEYQVKDFQTSIVCSEIREQRIKRNSNCEKPLVSIITVAFNSEKTIRKTIESVLNQTYTNIEYKIIDGVSSDDTIKIAEEYKEKFREKGMIFTISSEKDNGIYDAMNKGIYASTGEIVGIINSDDWYERDAIQTVIDNYNKTDFDYYYADVRLIKSDGSSFVKHSKNDRIVTSRHWNHPSCFVTKETYEKLGTFRCEGIHDDFDFFLRVKKSNKKIEIENKVIANFKTGGASNNKNIKKCLKRIKDRYRCYINNGYSSLYVFECIGIELAKFIIS